MCFVNLYIIYIILPYCNLFFRFFFYISSCNCPFLSPSLPVCSPFTLPLISFSSSFVYRFLLVLIFIYNYIPFLLVTVSIITLLAAIKLLKLAHLFPQQNVLLLLFCFVSYVYVFVHVFVL